MWPWISLRFLLNWAFCSRMVSLIVKLSTKIFYELLITEDVFISQETVGVDSTGFKAYWIKSQDGEWPFVKNKISFGNNSYIELSQMAYDD